MASDLFPIRRGASASAEKSNDSDTLLRGNPLSDALLRAFRQTFGGASNDAAMQQVEAFETKANGTIVPPSGETNP